MPLPADMNDLLRPSAYPHACGQVELIETHISWVLLAGEFAYKIKKPVRFSFVDFSTLARREHFCREELRCNRQFAPSLYLEVMAVCSAADGTLTFGGDGPVREWAVRMRRFPADRQLDRLLEAGRLNADLLSAFGTELARLHGRLPAQVFPASDLALRILAPARANFDDLDGLDGFQAWRPALQRLRRASDAAAAAHRELFLERLAAGWTRECHGDLHLSNLVWLDDGVAAFDCLEFDPDLRWIDPQCDVAFLFMDCLVRGQPALGYGFVDAYLDASGDYDGARLLPFYAAYRSMVRAKVAALGYGQQRQDDDRRRLLERFERHVQWTDRRANAGPGRLVLMCGLSGSGKSRLAGELARRLPALRLRTDVARKALADLPVRESAAAPVGEGLYTPDRVEAVYQWLQTVAADLLRSGENVIVDGTFLSEARRRQFLALGERCRARVRVVFCDAPVAVLRQRVADRARDADDASDAGPAVLESQLERFETPAGAVERVDTGRPIGAAGLTGLVERLLSAD